MAQCVRQRRPLPERIANAPQLQMGLGLFYIAFLDLTSERQVGEAIGAIPWTAIDRWCLANRISGEQREDVFYHVGRLDRAYIDWYTEKRRKEIAQEQAKVKAQSKRPTTKR